MFFRQKGASFLCPAGPAGQEFCNPRKYNGPARFVRIFRLLTGKGYVPFSVSSLNILFFCCIPVILV